MTTTFPTTLDTFTNPTPTDPENSVTVPHASQHANVNDAVAALEAKVGVNSSAVTTSLDYKVKDLVRALGFGGRLTLTSGTPVTAGDVTAATTIYCTPYISDVIPLWDGTKDVNTTFTETAIPLGTITASTLYDIFAYSNAGVAAFEILAWSNSSLATAARATGVSIQNGRYRKTGDATRLYLGTFYTTSTTTTEDSQSNRFLWNVYNQQSRSMWRWDSGSHTYSTTTFREWNNGTATRCSLICGLAGGAVSGAVNCTGIILADFIMPAWQNGGIVDFGVRFHNTSGATDGRACGYSFASLLGLNYVSVGEYGGNTWVEGVTTGRCMA